MNSGNIEQIGAPQELYHSPRTRFVAGFIGSPAMNFLPCTLEQNGAGLSVRLTDTLSFPVGDGPAARYRPHVGKQLVFGLRPEHITDPRNQERTDRHEFTVTADVVEPMGMETLVYFRVNGDEVCARVDPSTAVEPGRPVKLTADLSHLHLIDPATDLVL